MAEFWRALRTLKALQAEQAAAELRRPCGPRAAAPARDAAAARRWRPTKRTRAPSLHRPDTPEWPPAPGALHEPAAPWTPNEPEAEGSARLKQPQIPAEPTVPAGPPCSTRGEHQVRTASRQTNLSAVDPTSPGADEDLSCRLVQASDVTVTLRFMRICGASNRVSEDFPELIFAATPLQRYAIASWPTAGVTAPELPGVGLRSRRRMPLPGSAVSKPSKTPGPGPVTPAMPLSSTCSCTGT